VLPQGLVYFGSWRTLRWFLLLVLPLLFSAGAAYLLGRGLGTAFGILVMGVGFAAMLFVALCSGIASSNWGTFERRREPVPFWLVVGWVGLFYLLLAFIGYADLLKAT